MIESNPPKSIMLVGRLTALGRGGCSGWGVQWMAGTGGATSRRLTKTFETRSVSQIQTMKSQATTPGFHYTPPLRNAKLFWPHGTSSGERATRGQDIIMISVSMISRYHYMLVVIGLLCTISMYYMYVHIYIYIYIYIMYAHHL